MRVGRRIAFLAILTCCNPAFGQQHLNRGGHPAAGGGHPAQNHMMPGARPHVMTPQHHENILNQQMINDQMMFESIMNSRIRPSRSHGAPSQSGGRRQPASNNRAHSNAATQNKPNSPQPRSTSPQPKAKQQRPDSPGNVAKQPKDGHEKDAKAKEAAAHKKHEELRHHEMKAAIPKNNRRPHGSDVVSINLLKNALHKLRNADHDYAGHRVESMRHVSRALDHLTGSYMFDHPGSGAGNLPQAQSDILLREAEGHLMTVEHNLMTRANSLEHHHNARSSVAEAIHEVRMALNVN